MLPFPHMMDFFADELACLGGGRLAFTSILAGAFDGLFLGHSLLLKSPLSAVYRALSGAPIGERM
jgi:hypothetical protein